MPTSRNNVIIAVLALTLAGQALAAQPTSDNTTQEQIIFPASSDEYYRSIGRDPKTSQPAVERRPAVVLSDLTSDQIVEELSKLPPFDFAAEQKKHLFKLQHELGLPIKDVRTGEVIENPSAEATAAWNNELSRRAYDKAMEVKIALDKQRSDVWVMVHNKASAEAQETLAKRSAVTEKSINHTLKRISDRAIAAGYGQQGYNDIMGRAIAEIREAAVKIPSSEAEGFTYPTPEIDGVLESSESGRKKSGGSGTSESDPVKVKLETLESINSYYQSQRPKPIQVDAETAKKSVLDGTMLKVLHRNIVPIGDGRTVTVTYLLPNGSIVFVSNVPYIDGKIDEVDEAKKLHEKIEKLVNESTALADKGFDGSHGKDYYLTQDARLYIGDQELIDQAQIEQLAKLLGLKSRTQFLDLAALLTVKINTTAATDRADHVGTSATYDVNRDLTGDLKAVTPVH